MQEEDEDSREAAETAEQLEPFELPGEEPLPLDVEARMQKVSLVVSLLALGMMFLGFADSAFMGSSLCLPGEPVVPLGDFGGGVSSSMAGLRAMSAGIVLFAALPGIRVLLAMWLYIREGEYLNASVALSVLAELLLSARVS